MQITLYLIFGAFVGLASNQKYLVALGWLFTGLIIGKLCLASIL